VKTAIRKLKQDVKQRASEGKALRQEIRDLGTAPETGPARSLLWGRKRDVGAGARLSHLAYGLLRGLPYRAMEPKTQEGNVPACSLVLERIHAVLDEEAKAAWTQERVISLIFKGVDPAEEQAA